jgi:hypothetical protein
VGVEAQGTSPYQNFVPKSTTIISIKPEKEKISIKHALGPYLGKHVMGVIWGSLAI